MPKRRSTILGLGALAMGSGAAFTNAAFSNSVNAGADFRVLAASDLRVQPGPAFQGESYADYVIDDFDSASGIDFGGINPSDLPLAWAATDGEGVLEDNEALDVALARLNNASEVTFEGLVEIVNESDSDETVGISYENGYNDTNVSTTDNTNQGDGSEVSIKDAQEMFQFEAQADGDLAFSSDTLISPDPDGTWDDDEGDYDTFDSNEPANYIQLEPGNSVTVDVITDLTGDQVSIVQDATDIGGSPFDGGTDGFGVLETIEVGTEDTT